MRRAATHFVLPLLLGVLLARCNGSRSPGDWNTGHALFTAIGDDDFVATADLALYDAMKTAYADRR